MNRSDVELVVSFFEPDAEVYMRGMEGVGIAARYDGHDGIRALYSDLDEAWDDWSYAIREIVDRGDRLVARADFVGRGRTSGAQITLSSVGTIIEVSPRGKVARQTWIVEPDGWSEALGALD